MAMPTEDDLEAAFKTIALFNDTIEALLKRTPSKAPNFLNALSRALGSTIQITGELDYRNGKRNILLLVGSQAFTLQFFEDGSFRYSASNTFEPELESGEI